MAKNGAPVKWTREKCFELLNDVDTLRYFEGFSLRKIFTTLARDDKWSAFVGGTKDVEATAETLRQEYYKTKEIPKFLKGDATSHPND